MQLQKDIKGLVKGNFEFRSIRNGTRVVTREMADYSAIRPHFDGRNLSYYTFHPKSDDPNKAVIRHLPINTPAEDICSGLTELGFSIMSARQLTANRRSREGYTQKLPLFLVTLKKIAISTDIFKHTSLCHIIIKVEAYKVRNGLTAKNLAISRKMQTTPSMYVVWGQSHT
jgi:hypothetical protein